MTAPAPFEHHRPTSLDEALSLAAQYGAEARVLAGGTELVPKMRSGVLSPGHVISINRVAELAAVEYDESHGLRIGAGARLADVGQHAAVRRSYPALAQACSQMATPQIRHMGTVADNLVNGSPCADTATPLLVYEAEVELAKRDGRRRVALSDFFLNAGLVALEPGEILVGVTAPVPPLRAHSAFLRLSARSKVDVAAVNVAALLELDDDAKRVTAARVAIGAVAPTPLRCPEGERALSGQPPEPALLADAASRCAAIAQPIDDVRATAAYRRAVLPVLVRRVMERCLECAAGSEAAQGGAP